MIPTPNSGLAYTRDGHLAVSCYERQYDTVEVSGFSDVTLSGSAEGEHF